MNTDEILEQILDLRDYLNFLPSTFYITGTKYLSKYLEPVHALGPLINVPMWYKPEENRRYTAVLPVRLAAPFRCNYRGKPLLLTGLPRLTANFTG